MGDASDNNDATQDAEDAHNAEGAQDDANAHNADAHNAKGAQDDANAHNAEGAQDDANAHNADAHNAEGAQDDDAQDDDAHHKSIACFGASDSEAESLALTSSLCESDQQSDTDQGATTFARRRRSAKTGLVKKPLYG